MHVLVKSDHPFQKEVSPVIAGSDFSILDKISDIAYYSDVCVSKPFIFPRGRNGFDGDSEAEAAYRALLSARKSTGT